MSRIELAPEVGDDLERILAHLSEYEIEDAASRIRDIIKAISVLEHNPFIARLTTKGKRELVIGRSTHSYVALYRYIQELNIVFVLALRSQREAGYTHE